MTLGTEQWEKVKSLFAEALERTPGEREQFLVEHCSDESIRREVRSLLHNHESAQGFLPSSLNQTSDDSPAPLHAHRVLSVNTRLGPYEIVAFVGAGGMGEVYRARDTRLDREVAIKVMPSHFSQNPELRARFEREARAISGLQHPNICVLYDVGRKYDMDFLVMEYLEGETLSARIKKGPLPLEEALNIAIALADALGTAHRKRIIHRDVKPGNIMLTGTGPKLLDFGLAKYERLSTADEVTRTTVATDDTAIVGTLPYMSPEQLRGEAAEARSDIFAFGAVLYEMLTGRGAFHRTSNFETKVAVEREDPRPLREIVNDIPAELDHIVQHCLRKNPDERYGSISTVEQDLADCRSLVLESTTGLNRKLLWRQSRRPAVAIPVVLIVLSLIGLGSLQLQHSSRVRWAREQALPQIAQLIEQEKLPEAYSLAIQAERYIPNDPLLVKFWPKVSWSGSVETKPVGASVFRKKYSAPDNEWELVGRSPIAKRRFPLVDSEWKFVLKGHATVERATFPDDSLSVRMDEEGKAPPGMVRVELSTPSSETVPVKLTGLPGYEVLPPVPLGDYWIDKFEVTNAQFKRFVDQGGYETPEYWTEEFRKDGNRISPAEAMKLLVDKTGRPGPATWIQGEYPRGQGDYPVTGISWYEAAAYAAFVGKSLPTIYHWRAAASPQASADVLPVSNFASDGPAAVGTYRGMTWPGAFDMAGNVKEWILNEARSNKRFILGGAWNEPAYSFFEADARSPFDRLPTVGFRCAKYLLNGEEAKAASPVIVQVRDYSSERPVSDRVFQAYRSLYSYDKTPLNAVVESSQQTDDWKMERITYDAAYGSERIIAYLFLPKKSSAPFQTVVFFPGSSSLFQRSIENNTQRGMFDFVIKSGRAVMFPVYKSTYERKDEYRLGRKDTSIYRDHVIAWSKDLGRSIDYLETRPDIDHKKLAYEGSSWGAAMGLLFPAVEDRFKALVLVCPGLYFEKRFPEADQINFVPHVKTPTLMLNGRFDFIFPVDTSQEPMFRLLGTPKEHKRRVVFDSAHDIPREELIKETLNWLDRYLGLVK